MRISALFLLMLVSSSAAFASGFEKAVLWGGREAGIAGAGAADSKGPNALFFNPANLSAGTGTQISLNFSPTFAKFQGPFNNGTVSESSNRFIPIFGVTASHKFSDKLGVGVGSYISGGGQNEYLGIARPAGGFSGSGSFDPNGRSVITLIEHSVGVGYEVAPGFRIGASYRVLQAMARLTTPVFAFAATPAPNYTIAEYDQDLTATRWNGWRFGASYEGHRWGLGVTVRSSVNFTAHGEGNLKIWNSLVQTTPATYTNPDTMAATTFPLQAVLGGYYDAIENALRVHLEYAWTNYSGNDEVSRSGAFNGLNPALVTNFASIAAVPLQWGPLNTYRLGFEYSGWSPATLRLGYALSSQVTPFSLARPTFIAPGTGHTFTLGAGKDLNEQLALNGAVEYAFATGSVDSTQTVGPPFGAATGDYKSSAYALHIGATYKF